jgi:hypothetical protein
MNERIKELMGKTLDDKFSHTWTTMTYEDLEKFSEKLAELIVRECMNVLAESREVRQTAYYYRNRIAEHFGVDE